MLNQKIWVEKGFQSSVNISYDLNNTDKIKSFIATQASIDVIEEVLLSTSLTSGNKAKTLIGPYGKGKSHIVLIIISLLWKKDKNLFIEILDRIKLRNEKLYNFIMNYLESDRKLLPIVITGSSLSLTQSFLKALEQSLKNEDLLGIMPDTNFKAIINTIESWKLSYNETYNKFVQMIDVDINEFLINIKQYDINAYEKFNEIFPKLTSGALFNPFINIDVTEIYESVTSKLKDYGYSGIFIVYDEFSKYLESSVSNSSISDIKFLQDFAEKCDRSPIDKQMQIMLISHKDITNYLDKNISKEKIDAWRGVSGRFKNLNIHNNYSQMYEIISSVIKKDKQFWKSYRVKNKDEFSNITNNMNFKMIFDGIDLENIIDGCYPLHPISTFILPRLSEKVAQNERTLFTFLSSNNKNTLNEFLQNKNNFMLTPDLIYDYFEPLFRKENYNSDIYKLYSLASNLLKKIEGKDLENKIIKTVCLIYMIEQFEKLQPNYNIITEIFSGIDYSLEDIQKAIKSLIQEEFIIYLKRSNGYLKLKETSLIDIKYEISKFTEKNINSTSIKEILKSYISLLKSTSKSPAV